jgi:hypothetical protein
MKIARRSCCAVVACLLAGVMFSAPAAAQQIQQDAKVAEGRLTEEQTQSVRDFVEAWMGRLVSDEPSEVMDARNAILREFRTPGISETFRNAFSVEVSNMMGEAIRAEDDLVRINAMIIATQLTNPEADQLIDVGLSDENAAVQYWGAKAYLQRVERAMAEEGPGMSDDAQRAMIAKVQQVFAGSPSTPVARVGFEILSNLDVDEARDALLALLHSRVADHQDNPQASYLPEQTAIQLLSAEISRERRVDDEQVRELARAAYRYFALIHSQMQAGNILEEAEPGHKAMMDWCYKCLYAMSAKYPSLSVPNDATQVNDQIRLGRWDELGQVAQRWRGILTADPFGIPAADLD